MRSREDDCDGYARKQNRALIYQGTAFYMKPTTKNSNLEFRGFAPGSIHLKAQLLSCYYRI